MTQDGEPLEHLAAASSARVDSTGWVALESIPRAEETPLADRRLEASGRVTPSCAAEGLSELAHKP